jgi:hypothetical protein
VLWLTGMSLAAVGLLIRIFGVYRISLGAWTALILLLAGTPLIGLSSGSRLLHTLGLRIILPTLIVWILGTFTTWLSITEAKKMENPRERWLCFGHCMVAPLAMIGAFFSSILALVYLGELFVVVFEGPALIPCLFLLGVACISWPITTSRFRARWVILATAVLFCLCAAVFSDARIMSAVIGCFELVVAGLFWFVTLSYVRLVQSARAARRTSTSGFPA